MNWTVFFLTLIIVPGVAGIVTGLSMLAIHAPWWLIGVVALLVLATIFGLIVGDAGRYGGTL